MSRWRPPSPEPRHVLSHGSIGRPDTIALVAVLAGLVLILRLTGGAAAPFTPTRVVAVSGDPRQLPYDAARSLGRMFMGLLLATGFALPVGWAAAHSRRAGSTLGPLLAALQALPVLGVVVIAIGHGDVAVLAVFLALAWTMASAVYAAVRAVPVDLQDVGRMARLRSGRRAWRIELPASAVPLIWAATPSFGAAWFFLMAAEALTALHRRAALPGVGSYVTRAIADGRPDDVVLGIVTMVIMVVSVQVLLWRPVATWARRFSIEPAPPVPSEPWPEDRSRRRTWRWLGRGLALVAGAALVYGAGHARGTVLSALTSGAVTFARVAAVVGVATLIWVPVGAAIGLDRRLASTVGPVAQALASSPASLLLPFVTAALVALRVGLGLGGIVVMSLAAQWAIVLAAIGGARAFAPDLREASDALGLHGIRRWRRLVLPAMLPSSFSGALVASGVAWNAMILAEAVAYQRTTPAATGLGTFLMRAAEHGDAAALLTGVAVMTVAAMGADRLLWRPLRRLADTRYRP